MDAYIKATMPTNHNADNVGTSQAVKIQDNSLKQDTFELSDEKKAENKSQLFKK